MTTQTNLWSRSLVPGRLVMPPSATDVRYVARKVFGAEETGCYLQVLNVELFESAIGADTGRAARAVRISTTGTTIDTYGMIAHPYHRQPTEQATWTGMETSIGGAPGAVLDVAAQDPDYPKDLTSLLGWTPGTFNRYGSEKTDEIAMVGYQFLVGTADFHPKRIPTGLEATAQRAQDWMLDQISPTSRNKDYEISTSTSVGQSFGVYAGLGGIGLTGGFNANYTSSTSWNVEAYDLTADAGALGKAPTGAWVLQMNEKFQKMYEAPGMARGAVEPVFEAVFELKPGVTPRRYSLFTTCAKLGIGIMNHECGGLGTHKVVVGGGGVSFFNHADYIVSFLQSVMVDWDTGQVWATTADPTKSYPTLLATGTAQEIGTATKPHDEKDYGQVGSPLSTFWDTNAYRFHTYTADTYRDVLAPRIPDDRLPTPVTVVGPLRYRQGSPVGSVLFTSTGAGETVAVEFPGDWADRYPDGFVVRCTDHLGEWDHEWRPDQRRLLVRTEKNTTSHALWVLPAGPAADTGVRYDPTTRTATPSLPVTDLGLGLDEAPDACLPRSRSAPREGHYVFWRDAVFDWSPADRRLSRPRRVDATLVTGLPERFIGDLDAVLWCQDSRGPALLAVKDDEAVLIRPTDLKDPVVGKAEKVAPLNRWVDLTQAPEFVDEVDTGWNDTKDLATTPTAHLVRGDRHLALEVSTGGWKITTGPQPLASVVPGVTPPLRSCLNGVDTADHHYFFHAAAPRHASALTLVHVLSVDGNLEAVDLAAGREVGRPASVATSPEDMVMSPDGRLAYITGQEPKVPMTKGFVLVVDPHDHTVQGEPIAFDKTFPGGDTRTQELALSPDGATLFVTFLVQKAVAVVDTATRKVTTTVPLPHSAEGIAVSPTGDRVYVTHSDGNAVSVIDARKHTLRDKPVEIGQQPYRVAVGPGGRSVFVTTPHARQLAVIDTTTMTVITRIDVSGLPVDLTATPTGNSLYVAHAGEKKDDSGTTLAYDVLVIDTNTHKVTGTPIPVTDVPQQVRISPLGDLLFVVEGENATALQVFDPATRTSLGAPIHIGDQIQRIGVTQRRGPAAPEWT